MLSAKHGGRNVLPPKTPVYQVRVDGRLKAIKTASLPEARSLAEGFPGRRVEVVEITSGKVIDA
jgi:hypothetical protein